MGLPTRDDLDAHPVPRIDHLPPLALQQFDADRARALSGSTLLTLRKLPPAFSNFLSINGKNPAPPLPLPPLGSGWGRKFNINPPPSPTISRRQWNRPGAPAGPIDLRTDRSHPGSGAPCVYTRCQKHASKPPKGRDAPTHRPTDAASKRKRQSLQSCAPSLATACNLVAGPLALMTASTNASHPWRTRVRLHTESEIPQSWSLLFMPTPAKVATFFRGANIGGAMLASDRGAATENSAQRQRQPWPRPNGLARRAGG